MGNEFLPRKRCKRDNRPWSAHFLTFSTFKRQAFLKSERTCQWVCQAIDAARTKHPFHLWAFVIMPEHLHVVLLPLEGSDISDILHAIKRPVGYKAVTWVRKNRPSFLGSMIEPSSIIHPAYHFWQAGGGYDRNLRSAKDVHEKIHYIHANPVRRGLVPQPEAWPWSSCRAWLTGVDLPLRIDRESVPIVGL